MDSMIHAVMQATLVSKCVLVLLLCMSLASWAYIAGKWLVLRSAKKRIMEGTLLIG
jgi:biopolymer transport protein TolQ